LFGYLTNKSQRTIAINRARSVLGDISLLTGDTQSAMKSYLKEATDSPAHWHQAYGVSRLGASGINDKILFIPNVVCFSDK
jgi:hypothetical protein